MDDKKVPDSFDPRQPDLPTLAVDPDPDDVTTEGQTPGKYPPGGTETDRPAPRAPGGPDARADESGRDEEGTA